MAMTTRHLSDRLMSTFLTDYPDNPFSANTPRKVLEGTLADAVMHCIEVGDCDACKWLITTFRIAAQEIKRCEPWPIFRTIEYGKLDICRMFVEEQLITREDIVNNLHETGLFQQAAMRGHTHICQWMVTEFSLTKQDVKGSRNAFPIALHYTPPLDTCVWLTDTFGWTRQDVADKNLFDAIRCHNTSPRTVLWLICRFGVSLDEIGAHIHPWFLMSISDTIESLDPELAQEVRADNVRYCEKGSWVIRMLREGFGNSRQYWVVNKRQ
jgi:hypothetical protein